MELNLKEGFTTCVIGDMHFKETYGHAASFSDRRVTERAGIELSVAEAARACDLVVILGDMFDHRSNPSSALFSATAFLESLGSYPEIVILGGNHDTYADGSGALDYIRALSGKKWHVVSGKPETSVAGGRTLHFVPYMRCGSGQDTRALADEIVTGVAEGCDMLFTHHSVSGTAMANGTTDMLKGEPVLPREIVSEKSKLSFHGHIHRPGTYGNVIVAGSIMSEEAGDDTPKKVFVVDGTAVSEVTLPGRAMRRVKAETVKEAMEGIGDADFYRIVVTVPPTDAEIAALPANVEVSCVSAASRERTESADDGPISINPTELLTEYAEKKGVDKERIINGWNEIDKS
ncbi:MAG: metallophosphoesterase [Dehalococcoidia bacterium]|jgi:DNA repair exonuclease SbcCD nuclease subunit